MSSQRPKGTARTQQRAGCFGNSAQAHDQTAGSWYPWVRRALWGEKPFPTLGAQNSVWQGWDKLKS